MRKILLPLASFTGTALTADQVFVEAESFKDHGGWSLDTQFIEVMGSPYLLAHGMGDPVKDAVTVVKFPSTGSYRVWVRTMDWVARWNAPGTPGKFQLVVDGKPRAETFGTKGKAWAWQDGARFSGKARRRGQLRSRRDRRRIRRDCGGDFHGAHGLQGRARAGSRGARRQRNERGSHVSDERHAAREISDAQRDRGGIPGHREDVILTREHIVEKKEFPDARCRRRGTLTCITRRSITRRVHLAIDVVQLLPVE